MTHIDIRPADVPVVGFVVEGDISYAGKHLLIDAYNCNGKFDMASIEAMMVEACKATGATVLFHHAHLFDGHGSSGVVVLAESHGSWHSWPEEKFVAIDIFVCGVCDPHNAITHIEKLLKPTEMKIKLEKRGIKPNCF